MIAPRPTATADPASRTAGSRRRDANRAPPTATLVRASAASVAGDPMSGMTKNGRTKVATIAPIVFDAMREPVAVPSVPVSSPSSDAVAGKIRPIAIVGGRTTIAVVRANSWRISRTWIDAPLNGSVGEAMTVAPSVTSAAVRSSAKAISATIERTRVRTSPSSTAPAAIPTRNRTRMIVNTYVELPVPAPISRFHTTW